MPRRPKPWFKKSHNAWYVKIEGKLIRLADTEAEAWKEFHRRMATPTGEALKPKPGGRAGLGETMDAWIVAREKEDIKPATITLAKIYIQSFLDSTPKGMKAADVRPATVADWLALHPEWSKTTRSIAVRIVKSAFRWAAFEEWTPRDALTRMKAPTPESRPPAEAALVAEVLREVSLPSRALFTFMYLTGARPGEAIGVEARCIDFESGTIRVVGKMGERDVVFPSSYADELRELADRHPTGAVFRNSRDTPWTNGALRAQIGRAKRRLGLKGKFVPYHLRGIFASERIAAGVDSSIVGKMLGHSSPVMLHRHYHNPNLSTLRDAIDRESPKKKARPEPGE